MGEGLVRDLLTGSYSLHAPSSSKPLPELARVEFDLGECALCPTAPLDVSAPYVNASGPEGPPSHVTPSFFVVGNRFSVVSPVGGSSRLVLSKDHFLSLEDLPSSQEAWELGSLVFSLMDTSSFAFLNVGLNAGASLPHLHAQVISTDLPLPPCVLSDPHCSACLDRDAGFAVARSTTSLLYVPTATPNFLEMRVASLEHSATPSGDLLVLVFEFLSRAAERGFAWPYNVLFHPDPHPHLHFFLRWNLGLGFAQGLGVAVVPVDLSTVADRFASWF